jgi:predicted nucleic-acid-binding Zn-ribbon protein
MTKKRRFVVLTCLRCGHQWLARVERPVVCAKCKSPNWNKPPEVAAPRRVFNRSQIAKANGKGK